MNISEVFNLLPKTGCQECGANCLQFATEVCRGGRRVAECPHLSIEAKTKFLNSGLLFSRELNLNKKPTSTSNPTSSNPRVTPSAQIHLSEEQKKLINALEDMEQLISLIKEKVKGTLKENDKEKIRRNQGKLESSIEILRKYAQY